MTKPVRNRDWEELVVLAHPMPHSPWVALERRHMLLSRERTDAPVATVGLEHLSTLLANRLQQVLQLRHLEERVEDLEERVKALEAGGGALVFYVHTFAPEPYQVATPIPITIQAAGDSYTASFADANINSSGDNQQEAFANVKELILDIYDRLSSLPAAKLGPGPSQQLAVLREHIHASGLNNEGAR